VKEINKMTSMTTTETTHESLLPAVTAVRRTRNAGINLSLETIRILDELRGDIPKSRFTLRMIERAYQEKQQLREKEPANR
jgi:hypothetical protein